MLMLLMLGGTSDAAGQAACYEARDCIEAGATTPAVLVPNTKLRLCERYKTNAALLDTTLADAKAFRLERDLCVGELGAVLPQLRTAQARVDGLSLQVALLKDAEERRVKWWSWLLVGAVGVVAVEVGVYALTR
jgi:hypothetical protein